MNNKYKIYQSVHQMPGYIFLIKQQKHLIEFKSKIQLYTGDWNNLTDLEFKSPVLTSPGVKIEIKEKVWIIWKAMQRRMVHNKNMNTKAVFSITKVSKREERGPKSLIPFLWHWEVTSISNNHFKKFSYITQHSGLMTHTCQPTKWSSGWSLLVSHFTKSFRKWRKEKHTRWIFISLTVHSSRIKWLCEWLKKND